MTDQTIGVIGAGAWGTALATMLAAQGHAVHLWALEPDVAESINGQRINERYLPDTPLHKNLTASSDLADQKGRDIILMVAPAQFMRATLRSFAPFSHRGQVIVLCSKGIELGTEYLMTDVLREVLPDVVPSVLSGPSFAIDVAKGLPTAVTVACADIAIGDALARIINSQTFRPYTTTDVVGAEIGGAIKNVLAIACGIVLGMGLGRSAHAALIARGFAEMTRLGIAMGADPATLTGLCGLGDLVLTCSSQQSRNMSCGFALGQGQDLNTYLQENTAVVEGASSAPAVRKLMARYKVDMPICAAVADIVAGKMAAQDAVMALLTRPLKSEQV